MKDQHLGLLLSVSELSSLLAGSSDFGSFLERIVNLVSRHLNAHVSSIYLYEEESQQLVMSATSGLCPECVDNLRINEGQGLVGKSLQQRRSIVEQRAKDNPDYQYIPETGENETDSFIAVPIIRGLQKIGVLTAQRIEANPFKETDLLALQGVTSQVAGAIENVRSLMDLHSNRTQVLSDTAGQNLIKGQTASKGIVAGSSIRLRSQGTLRMNESESTYTLQDLDRAIRETSGQLKEIQIKMEQRLPEMVSLIFTAQQMMLRDPAFIGEIRERIEAGENPPASINIVCSRYIDLFRNSQHAYIQEKAQDVGDLMRRLLGNLTSGDKSHPIRLNGRIVVAAELFPSDMVMLASEEALAVILASGGITSHIAILARSLGIPMVIANDPILLNLPDGSDLLMDANIGNIYINPSDEVRQQFEERELIAQEIQSSSMKPQTHTSDGTRIILQSNINLLSELSLAKELKSEGVGLYRTEFPFLIRTTLPSEEEQYVIYRRLTEEMAAEEITIRTLDVGGDKALSYFEADGGDNPAMGLRSIRFSLRYEEIFRQQLRAILRAGAQHDRLRIMFPMISSLDEFITARHIVMSCIRELQREHIPCNTQPAIGMMIEVPSVVEIMDELSREADFFCIGTNDFIQYLLGVDRTNEKVAGYYTPANPAVLRALKRVVSLAGEKDISICGEMAHESEYIPFLIGIGLRKLSCDPRFLAQIQATIESISLNEAQAMATQMLAKV